MELTINDIISIVTLLLGGGGLGYLATLKWARKRAKAEADQAAASAKEAEAISEKAWFESVQAAIAATKEMQDSYQQLIADVKTDRDEQKAYINELKEDRQHLREERNDLRKRQDELEESVRSLQRDVARNGRMVEAMRPFLCGKSGCKERTAVVFNNIAEKEEKEITPYGMEIKNKDNG